MGDSLIDLYQRSQENLHNSTPMSPLEADGLQDAQQINFSRPQRAKSTVSRIPVARSSPLINRAPSASTPTQPPQTPARKASIKRARNSLEALNQRASTASVEGLEWVESPKTPEYSTSNKPSMPTTPIMPRTSSLGAPNFSSTNKNKRRSMPGAASIHQSGGSRSVSGPARQRISSGTYQPGPVIRPRTSSTPKRPINRPEGELPWAGDLLFKPDPRLPQDQQMLPTVAKRLAMEQGLYMPPNDESNPHIVSQLTSNVESEEAGEETRRSSSVRNFSRRGSVKSKKSSNPGAAEDTHELRTPELRTPELRTPEYEQQESEWPLRTPSLHNQTEANTQREYEFPTPPLSSHRPTVAGTNEYATAAPNNEHRDPFTAPLSVHMPPSSAPTTTAAPTAEQRLPFTAPPAAHMPPSFAPTTAADPTSEQRSSSTAPLTAHMPPSFAPSTTGPKPVRIPEAPLQKQEKEGTCGGCCVVM